MHAEMVHPEVQNLDCVCVLWGYYSYRCFMINHRCRRAPTFRLVAVIMSNTVHGKTALTSLLTTPGGLSWRFHCIIERPLTVVVAGLSTSCLYWSHNCIQINSSENASHWTSRDLKTMTDCINETVERQNHHGRKSFTLSETLKRNVNGLTEGNSALFSYLQPL